MMQKVQIDGGIISPTVTAHVQKNSAQPTHAHGTRGGGGIISPDLTTHVMALPVKVSMGGIIHPNVAKHLQAQ
jgi:hypothetical protein